MKTTWNFDRWMAVLGFLTGLIGLIFSWRANTITSQQSMAQMVVIDAREIELWQPNNVGPAENPTICRHRVRLSNLGGGATAIVRYDATISYKGEETRLKSSGEAFADSNYFGPPIMVGDIGHFSISLVNKDTPSGSAFSRMSTEEPVLSLPIHIDSYATQDVYAEIQFDHVNHSAIPSYDYFPQRHGSYLGTFDFEGYLPVEVAYTLYMSSGQAVTSPKSSCYYVK